MRLLIRTDGGSRGNPGPAAAGVVINNERGKTIFARGFFLGKTTNNVAEYEGFLQALKAAQQLGGTEVEFLCDSELLVKQINGDYRVKNPTLKSYHNQVVSLMREFDKVTVRHVYRSETAAADALVNQVLDAQTDIDQVNFSASTAKSKPNVVRAAARLGDKAQFDPSAAHRQTLGHEGSLVIELICLHTGQKCLLEENWQQATITVLRGKGTICLDRQKQIVIPGCWIHVGPVAQVNILADAGEQMVILLTLIKNR